MRTLARTRDARLRLQTRQPQASELGPSRNRRVVRIPLVGAACVLLLASVTGASPQGANLLNNPSFENGLTGWTPVASTAVIDSYGSPGAPVVAVGAQIGGGGLLLRDSGGNAQVEQVVSLGGVGPGMNLRAGGYFGGTGNDDARMIIRFLNGAGDEMSIKDLPYVTDVHRNFESVLMLREEIIPIPSGAASAAVRVEFVDNCCSFRSAAADALFLQAVNTPVIPSALPLDVELLSNASFEDGWANGSPLTLVDTQGWEGIGPNPCRVKPYSDADPSVPSTIVSCLIGGGSPSTSCLPGGAGNLLSDFGGGGALRQRIDVRGNLPAFATGTIGLQVSGFLGGVGTNEDAARIDVRFLDANQTRISPLPPVGPVTRAHRNSETVIMLRELEYFIPATCNYIEIDVVFINPCCTFTEGLLDNISAKLTTLSPPTPVAKDVNVLHNSSFEEGDLPGSPLQLNNPDGWFGNNNSSVIVKPYGLDGSVPTISFGSSNGLGGLLLNHNNGSPVLCQRVDLSGDSASIAAGDLSVLAMAWLGGSGNVTDTAEVRVRFLNQANGQVGGAGGLQILSPVTAGERANATTLIPRVSQFQVPSGTVTMEVSIQFTDNCCTFSYGLADHLEVFVFDNSTPGSGYCFGDGSGAACPCANSSSSASGCVNSTGLGGVLSANGTATVGSDTVTLIADQCPPDTPGLFFSGTTTLSGSPFGDGLRCVQTGIVRLGVSSTDAFGAAQSSGSLSSLGGLSGGELRHYQYWYRDVSGPCGAGFNTTNAYSIQW